MDGLIDRVLSRLDHVKSRADGGWMALCPAHDDTHRSLAVSWANERVLLHCFAGCNFERIMDTLGLNKSDAFAEDRVDDLERRIEQLERQQREHAERLRKLEQLRKSRIHEQYHNNLTPELRHNWYKDGIFDGTIDKFKLGYAPQCPTHSRSPSLTIPVFGYDNRLENVRHRLLEPERPGDKYRPEMRGLGSQLYNAPVLRKSHERVLVLEGEKKVCVFDQAGYIAVGVMGKSNWQAEWLKWFDVSRVLICLDPDAHDRALRLGQVFKKHDFKDVRVAHFALKPDDLIVRAGAGQRDIEAILSMARPLRKGKAS